MSRVQDLSTPQKTTGLPVDEPRHQNFDRFFAALNKLGEQFPSCRMGVLLPLDGNDSSSRNLVRGEWGLLGRDSAPAGKPSGLTGKNGYHGLARGAPFYRALPLFLILLALVGSMIFGSPTSKLGSPTSENYILPASIIEKISFGFRNLFSDFYWLKAVQATGGWRGKNNILPAFLDLTTRLDPRFEYPYLFSILVLPDKRWGYLEEARIIAERGMAALPDNWQIPFYLGTEYHIAARDTENALKFLNIAAGKPVSPEIAKTTLAIYAARSGDVVSSRALFETIYLTADNENSREIAQNWLERLDMLGELQQAVFFYKQKFGVFPESLDDLILSGIILEIPLSLENFGLEINHRSGALQFVR